MFHKTPTKILLTDFIKLISPFKTFGLWSTNISEKSHMVMRI